MSWSVRVCFRIRMRSGTSLLVPLISAFSPPYILLVMDHRLLSVYWHFLFLFLFFFSLKSCFVVHSIEICWFSCFRALQLVKVLVWNAYFDTIDTMHPHSQWIQSKEKECKLYVLKPSTLFWRWIIWGCNMADSWVIRPAEFATVGTYC